MTLCHSCLELSQPQPHLSSTVVLTSRYGRPNSRPTDDKAEVCPTKATDSALAGQCEPGTGLLTQAQPLREGAQLVCNASPFQFDFIFWEKSCTCFHTRK